jgi:PPP family 3-phenylpropionic acid transporter
MWNVRRRFFQQVIVLTVFLPEGGAMPLASDFETSSATGSPQKSAIEAPAEIQFSAGISFSTYSRLSSFYFFYFALLGAWLPFWPLYLHQLGYGAASIGALAAIMQGTKIIAPSIWGWLADRTHKRLRIIRWGAFAASLIFAGVFFDHDFYWLAFIVAAYSFFWNAVLAQFEVVTLAHLGSRYQNYSRIRVWGSVGFIGAVVGLGYLFDVIALTWLPVLLFALLAGIWLSSLAVGEPPAALSSATKKSGSLRTILRRPVVIAFFATCFLLQAAHGAYYTFFSVWLEQNGYSRSQTGLLWSLGVVAEVVLFLFMHRLIQRYSVRTILIASLLLTVVRWLLIAYGVTILPVLLFAQCLHAASFASYHACAVELVRRLFAGGHQGQGMALYSGLAYGLGGAVGALISGGLWAYSPAGTFVVAALMALAAVLIAWRWIYLPDDVAQG